MKMLAVDDAKLCAQDQLLFKAWVEPDKKTTSDTVLKAFHRGLTFTIVPSKNNPANKRVELAGSLHKYARNGIHNADDFTVVDLQGVIRELISTYGINPHLSTLNTLEFGVNLSLPYPVSNLLNALITHRGIPFIRHNENGFDYYQAKRQQYIIKIYDKGKQYNLAGNVVRIEIKVCKMEYLHRRKISIHVLADLLNQKFYPSLCELLIKTYKEILFDDPHIRLDELPPNEKVLLIQGRNPRFWVRPDKGQWGYEGMRKKQQRDEALFRTLTYIYRRGRDFLYEIAALIRAKWNELTDIPEQYVADGTPPDQPCPKLTGVCKQCPELTGVCQLCPKLTGVLQESLLTDELSQINTKDVGVILDIVPAKEPVHSACLLSDNNVSGGGEDEVKRNQEKPDPSASTSKPLPTQKASVIINKKSRYCPATKICVDHQPPNKAFVSSETLLSLHENDRERFDELATRLLRPKFRERSIDKQCNLLAKKIYEEYRGAPFEEFMEWLRTEWKRGKETPPASCEEFEQLVNREITCKELIRQRKRSAKAQ